MVCVYVFVHVWASELVCVRACECVHGVHAREFLCMCVCNQAHLHTVFVCRSVNVLSRVDIIQSFTYLSCVIIWTSLRRGERVQEKVRGNTNCLS